ALYWPNFNLDIKNPHAPEALDHRQPEELASSIAEKAERISTIMAEVEGILNERPEQAARSTLEGARA
ncbi:MAG: hypothetical protein KDB14_20295, partial [Planctomycetales bacterium]|nr:hypothetical protein [Planctomycetales bacterium]